MRWTSIVAIWGLFWVLSAFLVLPFGVRTHDEEGLKKIPGQADSAPTQFNPKRIAKRATVVSIFMFALFYINYVNGWITSDDLDVGGGAPDLYVMPKSN